MRFYKLIRMEIRFAVYFLRSVIKFCLPNKTESVYDRCDGWIINGFDRKIGKSDCGRKNDVNRCYVIE